MDRRCAWRAVLWWIVSAPAFAQTVYVCERDGVKQFHDRPCGTDQSIRELAVTEGSAPPPGVQAELDHAAKRKPARTSRRPIEPRARQAQSYRCTASDASVFYRHTRCPASIPNLSRTTAAGGDPTRASASTLAVTREAVPRALACREIGRAGAIVRRGRAHDEATDTYEKNRGRDPCG